MGKVLDTRRYAYHKDTQHLMHMHASGTKAMNGTVDNAAAVDAGSGQVTIPATAHGFAAGSHIGIRGSTNYDGVYELISVAADTFNIYATYVAENLAGTETIRPEFEPGCAFRLAEVRLHLSANGGAQENFSVILDSGLGDAFNLVLVEKDMNAADNIHEVFAGDTCFFSDDYLYAAYANSQNKTWGLEMLFQLIDA